MSPVPSHVINSKNPFFVVARNQSIMLYHGLLFSHPTYGFLKRWHILGDLGFHELPWTDMGSLLELVFDMNLLEVVIKKKTMEPHRMRSSDSLVFVLLYLKLVVGCLRDHQDRTLGIGSIRKFALTDYGILLISEAVRKVQAVGMDVTRVLSVLSARDLEDLQVYIDHVEDYRGR